MRKPPDAETSWCGNFLMRKPPDAETCGNCLMRKLPDHGIFVLFSQTRFSERISIPREDHNFLWILKFKVKLFLSVITHIPWRWIVSGGKLHLFVSPTLECSPSSPGNSLCYPLYTNLRHTQSSCGPTAEYKTAPVRNRIRVVHCLASHFSEPTRPLYSLSSITVDVILASNNGHK